MILIKFIVVYFFLLAWLVNGDSNPCFQNGYSSECTDLIRSRYNLTFDAFERVRNHIKLLVDAGRLRTPSEGSIRPFDMAMGCYAVGQRIPADDCASCAHCTQQQTAEVCDVFCSLAASPAPNTDANLSTTSTPNGLLVLYIVVGGLVLIFAVAIAFVVLYFIRRRLHCCASQNCMLYLFIYCFKFSNFLLVMKLLIYYKLLAARQQAITQNDDQATLNNTTTNGTAGRDGVSIVDIRAGTVHVHFHPDNEVAPTDGIGMDNEAVRLVSDGPVERPELSTIPIPSPQSPSRPATTSNPQPILPPPAAPSEGDVSSSASASASPRRDADDAQGPRSGTASMSVHVPLRTDRQVADAVDEDTTLLPPKKSE